MSPSTEGRPYYRDDLARVHHEGFGFHADRCASDIASLLAPLREDGLVLELGCGSGLLTRHLVAAGFRVVATDASPAMLDLAKSYAQGAEDFQQLVLPNDPLPPADAIVSIGHVLNYLPDETSIESALVQITEALSPGGILAIDLCDLEWGRARQNERYKFWRTETWALMTELSMPSPTRYVREMTTFIRNDDGRWRRDDERHDNVLIDTSRVPSLLGKHGLEASVSSSFGRDDLPVGLVAVIGRRS